MALRPSYADWLKGSASALGASNGGTNAKVAEQMEWSGNTPQIPNVGQMLDHEQLIDEVESAIPQLGLHPLRVLKGEILPKGMVQNSSMILINLGSEMMHINQAQIQPHIDHLTCHTNIGKFIGHRLDNVAQIMGWQA